MHKKNNYLLDWIDQRTWLTIAIVMVVVAMAIAGANQLRFSADFEVYFDPGNHQLNTYHSLQKTYNKDDNILFVVAPKDKSIFTKSNLTLLKELTDKAWYLPHATRVDSITNFQHTSADGDNLTIADLVNQDTQLTDKNIAAIKSVALKEPVLVARAVSPQGHVASVSVTALLDEDDRQSSLTKVAAAARQLAEEFENTYPGTKIYLTGGIMMDAAFAEATIADMVTLTPVMYLVIIILLAIIIGSIKATIITTCVIIVATAATMGTAGWLGIVLSPPTSAATTIILTLAIAGCVHLLVGFQTALSQKNSTKQALCESISENFQPILICTITTLTGFLSFNFSESPPFRDLGNIVALGIIWTFVLIMTLLPALIIIIPSKEKPRPPNEFITQQLGKIVIKYRTALTILAPVVILIPLAFILDNELNDEYVRYFDESVPFRQATEFSAKNLGGTYQIDYSLSSGESGAINSPDYLKSVEAFASWYRQQPETRFVGTIVDTVKRLNRDMHGGAEEWYRIPNEQELAAQYLLLYEISLPPGLDLKSQIDIDKSATRFTVTLANLSSKQLLELEARADQWLTNNAPELKATPTGPAIMFAHIGMTNIKSMLTGTLLAMVLISLVLIISFRSIKYGLLALIPNLVPLLMSFGLWGMFKGQITLAIAVVSGMTLGIIVDDTIHFMSRYIKGRRSFYLSAEDAICYAFERSGFALTTTTIVLVAGFSVLSFSNYEVNSSMAVLSIITLIIALIIDFLFLPILLITTDRFITSNNQTTSLIEIEEFNGATNNAVKSQ